MVEFIFYTLIFVILGTLIAFSLKERTRVRTRNYMQDLPDIVTSPLSKALANLIGTAGGIYLSLIMLTTFLEIPVPDKVDFIGIYLEPLAGISVLLAIIQPFVLKVYFKFKYRI